MLGIDVFQRYQGAIDWPSVAADGIQFAYIKLTNGGSRAAPPGDVYVVGARAAGLHVGGYAYALGGSADPVAQADAFAAELARLGPMDIAPALDFEDPGLPADAASRRTWIASWVRELAWKSGVDTVLLYSSASELTAIGPAAISVPGVRVMVWDAEYGPNDGAEHAMRAYAGHVAVHQFTSAGHVAGIPSAVDLDDATDDILEDDMAVTDPLINSATGQPWTRPDGSAVTLSDALANLYLGRFFADQNLPGGESEDAAMSGVLSELEQAQTTLTQAESDLLAAIKAVGQVTVDPTVLETALSVAGVPQAIARALLALLGQAAAGNAPTPAPTEGG